MLDKDVPLKQLLLESHLERDLPENLLKLIPRVEIASNVAQIQDHSVFYLSSDPPQGHRVKACVILLHDQTNTSTIWKEIGTMQTFSAFGYKCIAPDLPGQGRTERRKNPAIEEGSEFIFDFLESLDLQEVIVLGSSMAGQYVVPLLSKSLKPSNVHVHALVAVALSDTNKLVADSLRSVWTPCLALRGAFDTSLGMNSTNSLSTLPNSRIVVISDAKHLCHISNPALFHKIVLNFLEVVLKNACKKSVFVTDL